MHSHSGYYYILLTCCNYCGVISFEVDILLRRVLSLIHADVGVRVVRVLVYM